MIGKGFMLIRNEHTRKRFKLRISDKDIQFSLVIYGAFLYQGFGK